MRSFYPLMVRSAAQPSVSNHVAPIAGTPPPLHALTSIERRWRSSPMGRYLLLWLLGVPIPILVLIYAFGGLH